MRRFAAILTAALLAVTPAFAELPFTGYKARGPIAGTSSTASADNVALYIKFVGTSSTTKSTVAVSAAGDISFVLNGSADTTIGLPTANGTIVVSDSTADTFVEVVNAINASANWRAVLVDSLGSDSSNDSLATLSATDTNIRTTGVPLYYDTNYAGSSPTVTVMVRPPASDGGYFFSGPNGGLNSNPFDRLVSFLSGVSEKKTSTGTIAATVVYGVTRTYVGVSRTLQSAVRTIWSQTGGATATQATLDFSNFPLVSKPGEVFIVRIGSSTTISAQNLNAVGVIAEQQ